MSHPTDRAALERLVAEGRCPDFLFFWGHTQDGETVTRACLSQWYVAPFEVDGDRYPTAEHFMMAGKARVFGDGDALERILATESPHDAKKIGRQVRDFTKDVWAAHRMDIVVAGNVAKFSQHEALKAFLLETGNRILVEAAPRDRIWGIGMGANNENARHPAKWRGLNLLGFALMEARAQIAAGAASS